MINNDREVLLVIARAIGKEITPIQLQKAVFLISKEQLDGLPRLNYRFKAYHYGPFSKEIYVDAEELHELGMVLRAPSRNGPWIDTVITPKGLRAAEEIWEELPSQTAKRIDEIADMVISMSFQDLTKHIYDRFPGFARNSTIRRPT